MLIVPAGCAQTLSGRALVRRQVEAEEHCAMLVDGLITFDASDHASPGTIRTICATVSATYAGSFGLFDRMDGPLVRDMTALPAVRRAFDQLLAERINPDIGTHALAEALMKQCLVLFVRAELSNGAEGSLLFANLRDPRLAAAVREVLRTPAAPRTVDDLASVAGMSRSAFAAAFSEAFSQSPMDFVQKTRLHMAAKLLAATDLPVKVIAASMGFRSRSHFSRAFRRANGMDPSAYRRAHQNIGSDPPARSGRGWVERATSDGIDGAAT
ncbi:MAG: AraC family transcriptional regulator [Sphingomonadales bacterium]|nr:AraC family transcriptional regulator [Sphingomonadales bacterium]